MANPGPNLFTFTTKAYPLQDPDGTSLGATVTDLVGMHGYAVAQASAITSVTTAAATQSSPYGYATAAQADAIVTDINSILVALRNKGIIASS